MLRLRRRHKRIKRSDNSEPNSVAPQTEKIKEAVPVKPVRRLREIINNPNFGFQLMTVLLTFTSDNVRMDRRLDNMTSTVDKVRNITDTINNTMRSLKAAAEAPAQIKRLLK